MIDYFSLSFIKMKVFSITNLEQTKYRCLAGSIITLEGLIGVGKSTLGISLENYLNKIGIKARFFPEYLCEPLLKQYISDMKKYSYSFQIIMLQKRLEIYQKAHQYSLTGGIAIVDRSLIGDYTFAKMQNQAGFISSEEMEVYLSIMNQEITIEPTNIIFLDCLPEVAYQRMIGRGNQAEKKGYSIDYFEKLSEAYQKTLKKTFHKVTKIDWNFPLENNEGISKIVLDKLKSLL